MNYRRLAVVLVIMLAVLLILVGGGLLWLKSAVRLQPQARLATRGSSAAVEATETEAASARQPSASTIPESAAVVSPAERGPEGPPPGAAFVPQEPTATPAGPEVGPGLTPAVVLENMRTVFRHYHSRFGGNPVGDNQEITRALNGGNARQVVFLNPDDGTRLNDRGELIDNWGTPFFFHQLSGTEMEIRSAGPDGTMWTSDDLVIK